jgi:hypothetical protein
MEKPQHTIHIQPFKTSLILAAISLTILVFSLLGQRPYNTGNPTEKFFRELFTTEFFVNNGENVATYWNMILLIFVSVLGFAIASIKQMQKDRFRYGWWGFGILFFYFAVDTLAGINRKLFILLRDLPAMEGGFLYNWFYPLTGVILILVLLFFIWFYLRLDAANKFLFPVALILYIAGAYKAELFIEGYAELHGTVSSAYLILIHAGELMEYLGLLLMIYLLLTYLATHVSEIEFTA